MRVAETAKTDHKVCKCRCNNINTSNIGEIVSKIIQEAMQKGKVVIKLEIELHNE